MPGGRTAATTRPPSGKPGRPSALTEQTRKKFRLAMLGGNTVEDAFVYAGIHPSTGHRWIARGRKERSGEYREFYELSETVRAEVKVSLVTSVHLEAKRNPNMALRILERRYPEWAKREKHELEDRRPKRDTIREKLLGQLERMEERLREPPPVPVASPADDDEEEGG